MKINKLLLMPALISLLFSACSDPVEERSSLTNVAKFSIESATDDFTVAETHTTHTVDFTVDANQIIEGDVSITIGPNTTATEGVDFILNNTEVSLDPYARVGSFTFDVFDDIFLEGNEVIEFVLNTSATPFFTSGTPRSVIVTIEDFLTDDLFLTFDWEGTFVYDGDTYTICPFVDLDVYVLDAAGNDLGIYDAATGACPESMIPADWADGDYYLASNMWDNSTLKGLGLNLDYTILVTAYRQGKIDFSYTPTDSWNSEDDDQANDGNAAFKEVVNINVAGDVFTITAPDGTVLGSGFNAPHKVALK